MPADRWLEEHHAYLQLMIDLAEKGRSDFDVIHNNCLHYLPVAMARRLPVRMICTLHTPPTPWLESAVQTGPCPVVFAAVSQTHRAGLAARDTEDPGYPQWCRSGQVAAGSGRGPVLWAGRIVPEKGPDLAILAAREAGLPLDLVGPSSIPATSRHV